jgi:hypothetical protein
MVLRKKKGKGCDQMRTFGGHWGLVLSLEMQMVMVYKRDVTDGRYESA